MRILIAMMMIAWSAALWADDNCKQSIVGGANFWSCDDLDKTLASRAEQGDKTAQYMLGMAYLQGKGEKVDPITKVMIYIGSSVRNGIDKDDSKAIWDIYKKYLPGNVEVIVADANPMLVARSHAKNRPTEKFYAVTGFRSSEDFQDLKRISAFKDLDNVQGLMVSGGENSNVRATSFRDAILNGSLDDVLDFFTKELTRQEILKIVKMLKQGIIAEMVAEKIQDIY